LSQLNKSSKPGRDANERDLRSTLLAFRDKLREALALSRGRRGGD
jgi:hypothetical protein